MTQIPEAGRQPRPGSVDPRCEGPRLTRRRLLRAGGGAAVGAVGAAAVAGAAGRVGLATPSRVGQPTGGRAVPELGREYLAYPDLSGRVTFSNCWGGERIPLVEQWIQDFNAIYPNITIESEVSGCPDLRDKHVTSLAGGAPPNVMMNLSEYAGSFAEQEALLPLDDLMRRDNVDPAWFYPAEYRARTWDGRTYGLPNVTGGAGAMLWVNTGLLRQIGVDPKTTFETWQDVEALAGPAKANGLFVADPMKGLTGHLAHTYANGGRYWDDELTRITWNEPAGLQAAEHLLRLVKGVAARYEDVAIASERADVIQVQDWAAQKHVTMINGSWCFFTLQANAPEIEYAVFPFPRNADNPASEGRTANLGGWMFSIPSGAEDQDAAWEWIKFTTLSTGACGFVEAQNRPSPVIACNEDPALSAANPYWPVVQDNLAKNVVLPTGPVWPELRQIALEMDEAIMYERMAPQEALDSHAERAQAVLDDYNATRDAG